MTVMVEAQNLDLAQYLRPRDRLIWGQGTGEPLTLTEALVAQRAKIGPVSAFVGSNFSTTFRPEHTDYIRFESFGAVGTLRRLTKAGALQVIPCHVGQIYRYIEAGLIGADVVFVQLSPAGSDGLHSFGLVNDYVQTALAKARVVIAEINDQVPHTNTQGRFDPMRADVIVHTSRPLIAIPPQPIGALESAIARHIAPYIEDGSCVQIGIGAVPDAILQLLGDRRDLGIHSGSIGDGLVDLMERGVVTNARKRNDVGLSVTGALIGSDRLYRFAHNNMKILMKTSPHTHGDAALAAIDKFVTINSALEVDLTGQVNAEQTGDDYVGGIGGQADFVRAGHRSPGGHSIIALPATAKDGAMSRIRVQLSGPVTSARYDVDVIVTEFGAADLRGQTIPERAKRLIAIAHPNFREALERDAHPMINRGF